MANWGVLKSAIAGIIKTNDNQEITGQLLQNVLNNIVGSVGENATLDDIEKITKEINAKKSFLDKKTYNNRLQNNVFYDKISRIILRR